MENIPQNKYPIQVVAVDPDGNFIPLNENPLVVQVQGGGGGGSATASNGLHAVGSDIRLGGDLTEATDVIARGNTLIIGNKPLSEIGTGVVNLLAINGNDSIQLASVAADGLSINVLDLTPNSTQVCLFSPNGTKYQILVDDAGVLSTTAV